MQRKLKRISSVRSWAKSWELRAAMSMARLWRGQGKRQQVDDLLATAYGWFTQRFDTLLPYAGGKLIADGFRLDEYFRDGDEDAALECVLVRNPPIRPTWFTSSSRRATSSPTRSCGFWPRPPSRARWWPRRSR